MQRKSIRDILLEVQSEYCYQCGSKITHKNIDLNDYCSYQCERLADNKTWPKEDDCPGCPAHKNGPHKMGCHYGGKNQLKINL